MNLIAWLGKGFSIIPQIAKGAIYKQDPLTCKNTLPFFSRIENGTTRRRIKIHW